MRVDVDQHGNSVEGLLSGHFKPGDEPTGGLNTAGARGTGRQGSAAPLNCGTWWLKALQAVGIKLPFFCAADWRLTSSRAWQGRALAAAQKTKHMT